MTFQTPLVVVSSVFAERLVRVMTGRAAYLPIVRITLAVKNTVGLKTHVVDVHALQQRKLLCAAMTRSTELLGQFIATQQTGIVDRLCRCFACFDGRDVLSAGTMTSFAAHTVRKLIQMQLRAAGNRTRCVTTETTRHLVGRQQATDSFVQRFRCVAWRANRKVECLRFAVETYQALVELSVAFQHVRLAHLTLSKSVGDRKRETILSVGH